MRANSERVALVTGASSGIGEAAALALVKAGFTVYGTSRKATLAEKRGGVIFLPLDVTSDESVSSAVQEVINRSGRIDVLVNNAGLGVVGAAEEISVGQAQELFDTNLFGTIRMANATLPHMRKQGVGRIINISSIVGLIPVPYLSLYASSKHALEGYSESLDHEVREQGIRVLLVEPGFTNTSFGTHRALADTPLPVYAAQRKIVDSGLDDSLNGGDPVSIVADAVVLAATTNRPKLRYPVGKTARRVSVARRYAPVSIFDKQIRKLNKLPA